MSDQFASNLAWADFAITEHPYEVRAADFVTASNAEFRHASSTSPLWHSPPLPQLVRQVLCSTADEGAVSPDELGLRNNVLNGTFVPSCWNPHVKTLGWAAYGLLGLQKSVRPKAERRRTPNKARFSLSMFCKGLMWTSGIEGTHAVCAVSPSCDGTRRAPSRPHVYVGESVCHANSTTHLYCVHPTCSCS